MEEEEKKKGAQAGTDIEQATEQPARANRDRYSAMFAEDNPDVDFEDKEARYGRMADERESYRKLRDSGKKFSGILDKHRWIGAMLADDETNPLVWLSKNGIDIKAALDDPEVMQKVTEAFDGWTQKQADGEAAERSQEEAIGESLNQLAGVQQEFGLSDEQMDRMWTHFWDEVFAPAFKGEVAKDTWVALMHAMNYDQDMANAREEAALQARNEKHANKVKTFDEQSVPPTFGQGAGGRVAPQRTEKKESLMDFVRRNS
ncbi:MAG: hypothetical protein IJT48_12070 [Bacteroidaceae bacterium]|nr:hypothetical protein [Bacteroidaceae bacterium]